MGAQLCTHLYTLLLPQRLHHIRQKPVMLRWHNAFGPGAVAQYAPHQTR